MGAAPPSPLKIVTKQQYDSALSDFSKSLTSDMNEGRGPQTQEQRDYLAATLSDYGKTMSVLPPPAPDLADETVQRARQAARRRLLMGGLTGPIDLSGASVGKPPPGLTGV